MVTQSIADLTLVEFLFIYLLINIFTTSVSDILGLVKQKYIGNELYHYLVYISFLFFIFAAIIYVFGPTLRQLVLAKLT